MNEDMLVTGLPIVLCESYPPGKMKVTYHYGSAVEIKCSKDIYDALKKKLGEKE